MLKISVEFLDQYRRFLADKKVPKPSHGHYQKWLRNYLDFCHKYGYIALDNDSMMAFVSKLHEKTKRYISKNKPLMPFNYIIN